MDSSRQLPAFAAYKLQKKQKHVIKKFQASIVNKNKKKVNKKRALNKKHLKEIKKDLQIKNLPTFVNKKPTETKIVSFNKESADKKLNGTVTKGAPDHTLSEVTAVQGEGSISKINYSRKKMKKPKSSTINTESKQTVSEGQKGSRSEYEGNKTSSDFKVINDDSRRRGKLMFEWLIHGLDVANFFENYWEKQPLYLSRKNLGYYSSLLSCEGIDNMLRNNNVFFTKNIDITTYRDGKRETHNPVGRAHAPVVWDYYSNGCSVRILNPQTFFPPVHSVCAILQEYFCCFVGANVYLTPAGTQGFAPHFDDIEAFVLQVEGRKHWRLYSPRSKFEVLPRVSSPNFTDDDLGEPILDITLQPGDLLYFPRGVIHQGNAMEDTHSLHITLSVYQCNSYADLLEMLVPVALSTAIEENPEFREGLPINYLNISGLVHSENSSNDRTQFFSKIQHLMSLLFQYARVDAAVDQLGTKFMHNALPPSLSTEIISRTVHGDGQCIKDGKIINKNKISLDTEVKLLQYHILRLVMESDGIRVYYSSSNTTEYQAIEEQYLEIDESLAPAVETLIQNYPKYIKVYDLPLDSDEEKIHIIEDLWKHGLLQTSRQIGSS